MRNPSEWNRDDDEIEDELDGAETFETEDADTDEVELEADDDGEYEDEEPGEDEDEDQDEDENLNGGLWDATTTGGGCFRTMVLAVAFWMAVACAALAFCVVFGGGWW